MKKPTEARLPPPSPVAPAVPLLVLGLTAALVFLALFQWLELRILEAGGSTTCEVSSTVSCGTVWSSPFAMRAHGLLGMPIAGLGLVYGLAAFALGLVFLHRLLSSRPLGPTVFALRVAAAVGVLACVVLAIASFAAGAVCLTCLGTYALVLGFAVVVWKLLPGPLKPASSAELKGGLALAAGLTLVAYLGVLPAGLASDKPVNSGASLQALPSGGGTSSGGTGSTSATAGNPATGSSATPATGTASTGTMSPREAELAAFLGALPDNEKMMVARALAMYRAEPVRVSSLPPARFRYGPESASVRMIEWTDVRCGHCRSLVEAMAQVKRAAPEGTLSVEPRHFPLDASCNPSAMAKGPGTSCVAAKAQICLEGAQDYWDLQHKLFESQQSLTPDKVMEIASSGSVPASKLKACIDSPATAQRLKEDIDLGMRFGISGTPLVVLNGKKAFPIPSFIYALAVTGGNAASPAFASLPTPPPTLEEPGHEGHNH